MKKKTLQKFSRLIASLVLVGAMSLGTVATVDAKTPLENGAYTYEEEEAAKAAITVVYKMGKHLLKYPDRLLERTICLSFK